MQYLQPVQPTRSFARMISLTLSTRANSPSPKSPASAYYDAFANGEKLPHDTIGLVIYAHQAIYRDDSPIENVVIDLSNNLGGSVDAAIFLMGWILGDAPFSVKDTFTGALSTAYYRADVNLDRKFNSGDVLDDKNIFVLISPVSFSCGNLVPAAQVTLGRACTSLLETGRE